MDIQDELQEKFINTIITAIIPATVAECIRQLPMLGVHVNTYSTAALISKITDELVINDTDNNKLHALGISKPYITNLKTIIGGLYADIIADVYENTRQIKDAIKEELRMELFVELNQMKKQLITSVNTPAKCDNAPTKTNTWDLPWNSQANSDGASVKFNLIGTNESIEDKLKNNELFNRVLLNLDRSKRGEAEYTADELIERRKDRFDGASVNDFKKRVAQSRVNYDEDSNADNGIWDKMYNDRYLN